MKKLLPLFILIFCIVGFSYSNTIQKDDLQNVTQKLSATNDYLNFFPIKMETFLYNTDQFDIMAKKSALATDSVPESRTNIEYNGNMATSVNWVWQNGEWKESTKTETYMRSETTLDSTIIYMYDTVSSSYVRYSKIAMEYDGDMKTKDLTYLRDSITGEMVLMMQTDYSYDGNGYLTGQQTNILSTDINDLVPLSKEEYFISDAGVKDSSKTSYWIAEMSIWQPMTMSHYFYQGNGKLDYTIDFTYDFVNQVWVKAHKAEYMYNTQGYVISESRSNWVEASQAWDPASKDSTIYKDDTKPLVDINIQKSTVSNELMVYQKTYLTYDQASSSEITALDNSISVYPNPATDYIKLRVAHPENASVKMYDFSGKLILEKNLQKEISTFPVQNLQKGSYLIRVNNNNKVSSRIILVN